MDWPQKPSCCLPLKPLSHPKRWRASRNKPASDKTHFVAKRRRSSLAACHGTETRLQGTSAACGPCAGQTVVTLTQPLFLWQPNPTNLEVLSSQLKEIDGTGVSNWHDQCLAWRIRDFGDATTCDSWRTPPSLPNRFLVAMCLHAVFLPVFKGGQPGGSPWGLLIYGRLPLPTDGFGGVCAAVDSDHLIEGLGVNHFQ